MRIIVFGGTGWVGHNIALAFHNVGHDVTTCSRGKMKMYEQEIPEDIRMLHADKTSESDMAQVFQEHYDVVIDSQPSVVSIDNITKNAHDLKHYVHCSSTGGYAPLQFVPGDETMPYSDFMGGWEIKAVVDAKIMDLHARQGFPATVIRPPGITGPGVFPHDNLGGRREDFIADILNETLLDLPNHGQALLQPIHVKDLARSFVLAAETPDSIGQIYNICLEKSVTLTRYLEITAQALGRKARINYMDVEALLKKHRKSVNPVLLQIHALHNCFDISKACEQLAYAPEYTTQQAIEELARLTAERITR